MVTVLNEQLSKEIQDAIDRADVDVFQQLIKTHNVGPSSFLYTKARRNAFPLLNRILNTDYTDYNCGAIVKMAGIMLAAGANPDMSAPYGLTGISLILHKQSFLDLSGAGYDVYLQTLMLVFEMITGDNADVNLCRRSYHARYPLDEVLSNHYLYLTRFKLEPSSQLADISRLVMDVMLQRGAIYDIGTQYLNEIEDDRMHAILEKHRSAPQPYVPKDVTMPLFHLLMDEQQAAAAVAHWNAVNNTRTKKTLRAIATVQQQAYYHANRLYGEKEVEATNYLAQTCSEILEKALKKEMLGYVRQISRKDAYAYNNYEIFKKQGCLQEENPIYVKPCYDDSVYTALYRGVLSASKTR